MNLSFEQELFLKLLLGIIFCFLGMLPILKKRNLNQSSYLVSMNFFISGIPFITFIILSFISYLSGNKYLMYLFMIFGIFLGFFISSIHAIYYRKKIINKTFKTLAISDFPLAIMTFIGLVMFLMGYFDKSLGL